jgi:cell division protein FtsB
MALQRRWTETLTAVVAIMFLLITLYGVNGKVNELQVRTSEIDEKTEELAGIQDQIDVLEAQAAELKGFRDDILQAVCVAVADTPRELRACERDNRLDRSGPGR